MSRLQAYCRSSMLLSRQTLQVIPERDPYMLQSHHLAPVVIFAVRARASVLFCSDGLLVHFRGRYRLARLRYYVLTDSRRAIQLCVQEVTRLNCLQSIRTLRTSNSAKARSTLLSAPPSSRVKRESTPLLLLCLYANIVLFPGPCFCIGWVVVHDF